MPPGETRDVRLRQWLRRATERFVRLPAREIPGAIGEGLREIVEFLDVDRATLLEFGPHGRDLTSTHAWAREGIEEYPVGSRLDGDLPWYRHTLAAGEPVVLRRTLDDLPEDAEEERAYCLSSGLRSNLSLPIRVGDVPAYALAIGSFRRVVDWSDETVELLDVAGSIMGAGLHRHRQHEALERARDLAEDFFDSIDSMAAVLDGDGTIVHVNRAWRDAPPTESMLRLVVPSEPVGESYPALLEAGPRGGSRLAVDLIDGVRSVLAGDLPEFLVEYGSSLGSEERWTLVRVLRRSSGGGGAIVMHVDVTLRVERTRRLEQSLEEIETLSRALEEEKLYLREEIQADHDFENIVGTSTSLRSTLSRIERASPTGATVLLLGETGTGKELLAHAVHERSARRARALIKVNCAALPSSLIESELFGHVKGAFTGATSDRKGRFELADGGTLFLDEIGDLDLELQAKLLRVLESGELERVGGARGTRVDVRLVAATNRDLAAMVARGEFREDLYHRLSTIPVEVPPLRRRVEDIPLLVWCFLERCELEWGRRIETVPVSVMSALQAYSWPGNVRELKNVIERAVILSPGEELMLDPGSLGPVEVGTTANGDESLDAVQRAHITRVLERCNWRINGAGNAADRLGIHPNTLRHRLKKLAVERPR